MKFFAYGLQRFQLVATAISSTFVRVSLVRIDNDSKLDKINRFAIFVQKFDSAAFQDVQLLDQETEEESGREEETRGNVER